MRSTSYLALLLVVATAAVATPADREGLDFFEAKIRPVLVDSCYKCHSAGAAAKKKLEGKLSLDTREALLRGGESGPAIVPGKPADSLLIKALRHQGPKMPPRKKLHEEIVAHFEKWISMGAPDPRDGDTGAGAAEIDMDAAREFWSFKPLAEVEAPTVDGAASIRTPIDRFILARQHAAKVEASSTADAHTLIRRVTYDLIGLPPEPHEVDEFVKQAAKDLDGAYGRLVDRLLASRSHAERWARHWLDLARFAESNGYAFDGDRPNAYQYRDFVIRALDADLPYDEFVSLQIAGDLLQPTALDAVAATGFIVAGPFTTQQTQKERERSRYEQLDDMVHTIGTSMLGLTIGCARCHEHKYDPLPHRDYHRLIACFREVGFSDTGVPRDPEKYRRARAEFDAALATLVAARDAFEKESLPARLGAWLASRPKDPPAPTLGGWHHIGPFASDSLDKAYDTPFPPESSTDLTMTYQDGKLAWKPQPGWIDGTVHNTFTGGNSANYIVRTIESPVAQPLALSLGSDDAIRVWLNRVEVLAKKVGRGAAPDQEKLEIPLKKGRNELLMKIVNGGGPSGFYFKSSTGGPSAEVVKILETPVGEWTEEQRKKASGYYRTLDEEWLKLNATVEEQRKKEPKPDDIKVFAAKVRGSTYGFGDDTYKVYYLGRGNPANKHEEAQPGFLQMLMRHDDGERHWLVGSGEKKPRSDRVALAEWITDVEHGAGNLLARVIVNRLWHHHFGRGIVRTPNDFGARGERPSHPELLEWLAGELVRGGWRLKPIHRLIVTSSVYMQGIAGTASGRSEDPENLLWWRREPRRVEAEVLRDALLAVSGTLDRKPYGKGSLDPKTTRRSIYLTVKRSRLIEILQLFDAPDAMQSIGSREESTVAPQALALLNAPFVGDLAAKLARRVRPSEETSLAEAIDLAYRVTLSSPATPAEQLRMNEFVKLQTRVRGDNAEAEALALRDVCHLLLCMNEFVYID